MDETDEVVRGIDVNSSANPKWPNKNIREAWEIHKFLNVVYARIHPERSLHIEKKSEKPDYLVVDDATGKRFYVELTEVYLDDRSVPDEHKPLFEGLGGTSINISLDRDKLERYKAQLIEAVRAKKCKSRKGYDLSFPLILSVYVNEYIAIYLTESELKALVSCNQEIFNDITPFHEVVFWNLANEEAFVLPDNSNCPSCKNETLINAELNEKNLTKDNK